MISNTSHGVSVELSAKATLIGNVVADNSGFGIKINDTSDVQDLEQHLDRQRSADQHRAGRPPGQQPATPGHDPRQPFPDPTMTWLNGPVEVRNNIISGTTGNCLLCVEDYSHQRSAEQMQVPRIGQCLPATTNSAPNWVVVWSTGAGNPAVFTTVAAFRRRPAGGGSACPGRRRGGQPNGSPTAR